MKQTTAPSTSASRKAHKQTSTVTQSPENNAPRLATTKRLKFSVIGLSRPASAAPAFGHPVKRLRHDNDNGAVEQGRPGIEWNRPQFLDADHRNLIHDVLHGYQRHDRGRFEQRNQLIYQFREHSA